jgi:hypothetical protein
MANKFKKGDLVHWSSEARYRGFEKTYLANGPFIIQKAHGDDRYDLGIPKLTNTHELWLEKDEVYDFIFGHKNEQV